MTQSTTTRWWWIRHAPVINPDGGIYGQSDLEADLSNGDQFGRLAEILPEDAVWVTTTLQRARETARKLAASVAPDRKITEDDGLREQAFGDWEGARWADIPARESEAYWRDPARTRMPNGESFTDVITRVTATVERLNSNHSGRNIIAVTHAGSIRAAISHALGGEPKAALSFQLTPLSLTRIDAIHRDGKIWWRVSGVNLFGNHS
ncbi:MAG: histidine phosphatase family protein [Proteobacteria bacterium]|nr:histidine phosphatase family protein [Pseudomonadota bacterium]MDA1323386.1 histidine phosphatase family protein [Pseudomonadota bacterium]